MGSGLYRKQALHAAAGDCGYLQAVTQDVQPCLMQRIGTRSNRIAGNPDSESAHVGFHGCGQDAGVGGQACQYHMVDLALFEQYRQRRGMQGGVPGFEQA